MASESPVDPGAGPLCRLPSAHPSGAGPCGQQPTPSSSLGYPRGVSPVSGEEERRRHCSQFPARSAQNTFTFLSSEARPLLRVARRRLPVSAAVPPCPSPGFPGASPGWSLTPGEGKEQVARSASRWVFHMTALFIFGDCACMINFLAAAAG